MFSQRSHPENRRPHCYFLLSSSPFSLSLLPSLLLRPGNRRGPHLMTHSQPSSSQAAPASRTCGTQSCHTNGNLLPCWPFSAVPCAVCSGATRHTRLTGVATSPKKKGGHTKLPDVRHPRASALTRGDGGKGPPLSLKVRIKACVPSRVQQSDNTTATASPSCLLKDPIQPIVVLTATFYFLLPLFPFLCCLGLLLRHVLTSCRPETETEGVLI